MCKIHDDFNFLIEIYDNNNNIRLIGDFEKPFKLTTDNSSISIELSINKSILYCTNIKFAKEIDNLILKYKLKLNLYLYKITTSKYIDVLNNKNVCNLIILKSLIDVSMLNILSLELHNYVYGLHLLKKITTLCCFAIINNKLKNKTKKLCKLKKNKIVSSNIYCIEIYFS